MCHPEVPEGTPIPNVRTNEARIPVDGGEMPALVAYPERAPAGAILVINDVFGRSPFYDTLTRRIAQAGYVGVDPEFFWRVGPPADASREAVTARSQKLDGPKMLEDLGRAIDWMKRLPEARGDRIGLVGFCMGGTAVLNLAALRDDLRAPVSYYGFPARGGPGVPAPLERAEAIRGPLLGHWGTEDTGVGIDNVRALDAKLKARGTPHTFHEYEGLGHGFLKASLEDEKTPGYEQACTSWKRTLAFWKERLAA